MGLSLTSDVQYIKGVGPAIGQLLNKLGLYSLKDCLVFFPREYDDRRKLPCIKEVECGDIVTLVLTLESMSDKKIKKGLHVIEAVTFDSSDWMKAVWFNQPYLLKVLKPGLKVLVKGKVETNLFTYMPQINVSETEILRSLDDIKKSTGVIIPTYNLTAGLYQAQMRDIIKQAFIVGKPLIYDNLTHHIKKDYNLMELLPAITEIHYPTSVENYKKARYRIVFDEFFFYQLRLENQRIKHKQIAKTAPLIGTHSLINRYYQALPYSLTNAQKKVINEILEDLRKPVAMNRLIQGDVGSGKTDVAIVSLLVAIESGKNGVLMAPTEILATQHYLKMKTLLNPFKINCTLLKGKMKKKEKEESLAIIESSEPCIVIGTHSLIEQYVALSNCGVMIIDEQHRFGVMQRIKLQDKAHNPHCLFMTATPIPRSYMLTCFGDLDKSIIDELPPGRIRPVTSLVTDEFLPQIYQKCGERLRLGDQMYSIFPLVEESEKVDLKSAVDGFESIRIIFKEYHVGLIHGRMKPDEKSKIMKDFKENKIQILVSTTVIEVGVDIPNATMMIIQDADRFGLSQLHQLRGRIGRGKKESYCFLISKSNSEQAKKRFKAITDTSDGFKIAEYDLKIRGPGDVLGTRQAGLPQFQLADLLRDEQVLLLARKVAKQVLKEDPDLNSNTYQSLKKQLDSFTDTMIGQHLN
ncbi:DNA helicase RecG [Candidatus Marinamargulisbacteria bacterium SCGC AG-333-B06]|nr:DNA helicase RecG [Candidatus Marinamargulisbacteria bacterium SCGC AG-333-B06]